MDFKNSIIKQHSFSPSQERAIEDFTNWWNSDSLIYTLTGAAGTGKTFLLKYLINHVMRGKKIAITAPTHKAVRVAEIMTGVKGRTIHSLHGLRPNTALETFNINNVKYESLGKIHIQDYDVVIVDEGSQINHGIAKLNETRARQFKVRIIYVGDKLQLPPVRSKDDPPLKKDEIDMSEIFKYPNTFELTDIVRQEKGNPLLELLAIARNDVQQGTTTILDYLSNNKYNIDEKNNRGYMVLSDREFASKCIEAFKGEQFHKDIDFCRYAAYTNAAINDWNKYIR